MANQQEPNASVMAFSKDKIIVIGAESTNKEFKGATSELADMASAFTIYSHVDLMMCSKTLFWVEAVNGLKAVLFIQILP